VYRKQAAELDQTCRDAAIRTLIKHHP